MKLRRLMMDAIVCIGLLIPFISLVPVQAADYIKNKVIVECDLPEEVNDYVLETDVRVEFCDPELYNPGVKLSYKVYDRNMNIISPENERVELDIENGIAVVHMKIDLTECGVDVGDNAIIRFDLVDETNIYWFWDNPYIEFQGREVYVNYSFIYNVKSTYLNIVKHQLPQLIINILGFGTMVFFLKKMRHIFY